MKKNNTEPIKMPKMPKNVQRKFDKFCETIKVLGQVNPELKGHIND